MTQVHHLNLPLDEAGGRALAAGDLVYLSGEIVVSAGLPAHHRLLEAIDGQRDFPFEMKHSAFFHLGSYIADTPEGGVYIEYINPTTSTRFNDLMPKLIGSLSLRMVGGKGGLDSRSVEAMRETGCVYLSFLGGGAPLHSQSIRRVVAVGSPDIVSHYRLLKLEVDDLGPLTVAIDAHGRSLYDELHASARAALPGILADLKASR